MKRSKQLVAALGMAGAVLMTVAFAAPASAQQSSLAFNGSSQYVTFGAASALNTASFTLECWFRRDGAGVTTSTGSASGGLPINGWANVVPLVTKGRGEGETPANINMNYFLGIRSDGKLVADFEESTGPNHAFGGKLTTIANGVWYHAAVTYNSVSGRYTLYLNGAVENDTTLTGGISPVTTSIQHAAVASALTSTGVAAGFFNGVMDEIRIWKVARDSTQIRTSMNSELTSDPDLLGRWGLNEGSGTIATNSIGTGPNGTLTNAPIWTAAGDPTSLAVTAFSNTRLDLTWADNASNETGYNVEQSTSGSGGPYTLLTTLAANSTSYSNTGLSPSTNYCYRVSAVKGPGNYAGPVCASTAATGALKLAGSTYVNMGNSSTLQLGAFTLEMWVRRDGAGVGTTTGTGGIPDAVPLIAKGRAEDETAAHDINYLFGIRQGTGVLCADLEEGAGGTSPSLNHPVVGTTVIPIGSWHHVAATYDGATWKLYLDGNLEAQLAVNQPTASASTVAVALGSALNSLNVPLGFFNGAIDEARIWNYARTQCEIQSTANTQITTPTTGLLARWGLDEGSGTAVNGSAGTTINGTISGSNFSWVLPSPFNIIPSLALCETHVNVVCNGQSTGSIDLTGSGGTAPYTYAWGDGPTTEDRTGLAAGTYSVTVTDAASQTATLSVTITQPPALSLSLTQTDITCNGLTNGTVTAAFSGGTGTLQVKIDSGSYATLTSPHTFTGLGSGSHTVTVKDANGCTLSMDATIANPLVLSLSLTPTDISCHGLTDGKIEATFSGGTGTLEVKLDGGSYAILTSPHTFTGLDAGPHTVELKDANGCTTTTGVTVTEPAALSLSETHTGTCVGTPDGTIDLTVTGGVAPYGYLWSNAATSQDLSGLGSGSYSVTVTDANGCTSTTSATIVTRQYTITATASSGGAISPPGVTTLDCGTGQAYTITADAGYHVVDVVLDGSTSLGPVTAYTFSNVTANRTIAATFALDDAAALVAVGTPSGALTQCNSTVTVPVTISRTATTPIKAVSVTVQLSSELAASGGTAAFTDGGFLPNPSFNVIDHGGGLYTVDVATLGDTPCGSSGTSGTLFNILLTNTGPTGPGSVTITDVKLRDCSNQPLASAASGPGSVSIVAPMTLSETHTNVACHGGLTGSVDLTVTGGSAPYSYSWNNGATTQDLAAVGAGSYSVSVTDANGCTSTTSVTVTQPAALALSETHTPTCLGTPDGTIDLTVSGGASPYTYAWSSGASTEDVSELAAGSYSVTVTDANGCTSAISTTIVLRTYLVTASAGSGGGISPSGDVSVNCGADQAFTITADAGYHVADVLVDGNSVGAVTAYTFTNVQANRTITASFGLGAAAALQFDGSNQYVTFGQAAPLGASRFTIELWFKKTGTGVTTSTGTGGVNALPLLTKGRAEADAGDNRDMNYFLGIDATGHLAADYEEGTGQLSPSLNHPVVGSTVIADNAWYHGAAVYDGSSLKLYLNGVQDGVTTGLAGRAPQSASIQHAGLGTALNSTGVASGFFAGVTDEPRIWNVARTQCEIVAGMNAEITSGTGLLGRWGLNEGSGALAANSVGGSPDGTLVNGPTWVPGAPFDLTPPVVPVPAAPSGLTAVAPDGVQVQLSWTDNANTEESFQIERAPIPDSLFTPIATVGANVTSYVDAPLEAHTKYCYQVRAVNCSGGSNPASACVTTGSGTCLALDLNPSGGGTRAYVNVGNSSALQLGAFTLEMWVRRDGAGVGTTTGTGGIPDAVPLIAKGRAEDETAAHDINYLLGIRQGTGVLCADLEEGPTGTSPSLNHPVVGTTLIPIGSWHHVAATYDGASWNLYLDGNLEAQLAVNQPAASASTVAVALGSALNSLNAPLGFFDGAIDEVRIWDYARNQAEIQATMRQSLSFPTPGLVGLWALEEAAGTTAYGTAGTGINGTIVGTAGTNWTRVACGSWVTGVEEDGPVAEFALRSVSPNPMQERASFGFALPQSAQVRLEILDLLGRRVATVAEGTFEAGVHRVTWNGSARDGSRASAGVYFVRFSAAGRTVSKRLVIVR